MHSDSYSFLWSFAWDAALQLDNNTLQVFAWAEALSYIHNIDGHSQQEKLNTDICLGKDTALGINKWCDT